MIRLQFQKLVKKFFFFCRIKIEFFLFIDLFKFRLLNKIFSRKNPQSKKLIEIQQSYRSHRPYFTYWVTFVQILVCIVSLIVYGYAPLGSTQSVKTYFFIPNKKQQILFFF